MLRELAFALALLASNAALATKHEVVASFGSGNSVTLRHSPCQSPKVAVMLVRSGATVEQANALMKTLSDATILWGGKTFEACWLMHDDHVDVIDENGGEGAIPLDKFKPLDVI